MFVFRVYYNYSDICIGNIISCSLGLWCVSEAMLRGSSCRQPANPLPASSTSTRSVSMLVLTHVWKLQCSMYMYMYLPVDCVWSRCCTAAGVHGCRGVSTVRRLRCCRSPGRPEATSGAILCMEQVHVLCIHVFLYRTCALRRVFPGWKAFVVLRRHKKAQVTLADQHFKSTALPKYVSTL